MDQKFSFSTYSSMVKNGFDNVLAVFCIKGGWLWKNSSGEEDGIVVMGLFKATGVDFGVDLIFLR